jgi:hypothetical protein
VERTIFGDVAREPGVSLLVASVEVVAAHGSVVERRDPTDRDRLVGDDELDLRFAAPDLVDAVPLAVEGDHAVLAGHPLVAFGGGVPVGVAGASAIIGPGDLVLNGVVDPHLFRDEGIRGVPYPYLVRVPFVHRVGAFVFDAFGFDSVDFYSVIYLERNGDHDSGAEVGARVRIGVGDCSVVAVVADEIAAPHREGDERSDGHEAVRVHGFPLCLPAGSFSAYSEIEPFPTFGWVRVCWSRWCGYGTVLEYRFRPICS